VTGLSSGLPGIQVAKYSQWRSPLAPAAVAAGAVRFREIALDGEDVYWLEGRPQERGRNVLVRRGPGGRIEEVTPPEVNVRSRVHEYGGGAYAVSAGTIYYVNFADQRVYRLGAGGVPEALTPESDPDALHHGPQWCYADLVIDDAHRQLIAVREDFTRDGGPDNTLVRIPLDGGARDAEIIASGADFYSTPRLSPDGARLCWLAWRQPQMPWEGTELWVAEVRSDGRLSGERHVAGGPRESIYQPGWSPDGRLHFVSDRDGWWKLYRLDTLDDAPVSVVADPPDRAEFGRPQWVFGSSSWTFAGPDRLIVSYTRLGRWRLATVDPASGVLTALAPELEPLEWLAADATRVVFVAATATRPPLVARLDPQSGLIEHLRAAAEAPLDASYVSSPEAFEFPTGQRRTAHGFYYPPRNRDFLAPAGERPPLIVISHGGPTAATSATFDLQVQFWTTHGFAVADVNYGGSSGYGRAYRERLNGQWGVVDVEDCVNAARYLATQGRADRRRLIIRGGSAGGYTTLAALTFHPRVFHAGASYYGICDLEALVRDSPKFERGSLETLVGPYPQMQDIYRARSPVHYVDRLGCPLIVFQGLEDKVVPPGQSESMVNAVRAKGLPVVYLAFEGEQHGFRKAETIIRCLEEELAFYRAVLG
jgi:dipeptidyl aminopeptidase/acylaminoacyl peptidase